MPHPFLTPIAATAATIAANRDEPQRYRTGIDGLWPPETVTEWGFSTSSGTRCHDRNLHPNQAVAGSSPVPRSEKIP
jgi:hypothetical protein